MRPEIEFLLFFGLLAAGILLSVVDWRTVFPKKLAMGS